MTRKELTDLLATLENVSESIGKSYNDDETFHLTVLQHQIRKQLLDHFTPEETNGPN